MILRGDLEEGKEQLKQIADEGYFDLIADISEVIDDEELKLY